MADCDGRYRVRRGGHGEIVGLRRIAHSIFLSETRGIPSHEDALVCATDWHIR